MMKVNFSLSIALQLLLTTSIFIVGWYMSNTKISLDKSAKTTGLVTYANIKTLISGHSGYSTGFLVQTKNAQNGYWVYRANGNYNKFFETVKLSTPVTIYHSETQQPNGYFDIYQLENGKSVIYPKEEYERKARLFGILIVIPSALALLFGICFQIKQRYNETHLAV